MKIIDRYLLKELLPTFGLGLSVFTFVLLMGQFLQLVKIIIPNRISINTVALLILYLLPSLAIFIIPMSFLFSVLLLFGRMSADNEILALRIAGVSLYRLISPVLIISFLLYSGTLGISCFLIPKGNEAFKKLLLATTWKGSAFVLEERTFNTVSEDLTIYIERVSGPFLDKVMVSDQRRKNEMLSIFAQTGEIIANDRLFKLILRRKDGSMHWNNPKNLNEYQQLTFSTYDILLSSGNAPKNKKARNMNMWELWREIEKEKKLGRLPYRLMIIFQERLVIPFACIIFALIGCPLGIQNRKNSRLSGFGLSILLLLLYYTLLVFGKTIAYGGFMQVWPAMWLPNIIFSLLGAYFLLHLEKT